MLLPLHALRDGEWSEESDVKRHFTTVDFKSMP